MLLRVQDDMKRWLTFAAEPKRVVSLVPSDTFSVAVLGCGGALVGRTDYCELPEDVALRVPSVGGTKNPNLEAILDLSPDLVIANQEENTKGDLEKLAQRGVKVLVAFPRRVGDGLAHLARLARIFRVDADPKVREMLKRGYEGVREAEDARARTVPLRTFCPIWMKPLMTIHGDTFISDVLDLAGAQNVFADRARRYPLAADLGKAVPLPDEEVAGRDTRYPRVTMEEVVARAPELVLLPDEPHPFTEEDADAFRALAIPAAGRGAVVRTSGKDLCWYGAQTIDGLPRVRSLIARYAAGAAIALAVLLPGRAARAADEPEQLLRQIDQEVTALSTQDCNIACRALASILRAADKLCALEPGSPRCTQARARADEAAQRVRGACPDCAIASRTMGDAVPAVQPSPPPPSEAKTGSVAAESAPRRGGCAGCTTASGASSASSGDVLWAALAMAAMCAVSVRRADRRRAGQRRRDRASARCSARPGARSPRSGSRAAR